MGWFLLPSINSLSADMIAVNLQKDRSLEQGYGENQPQWLFKAHDDSLDASEYAGVNTNLLTCLNVWKRLHTILGSHRRLQRSDFPVGESNGHASRTENLNDPGRGQDRQPGLDVKATAYISREKRLLRVLRARLISVRLLVQGQKGFVSLHL